MCYAPVVVTSKNLRVVTMHNNKESQKEIIVIEAIVWAFWIFIFGFIYLPGKVIF